MLFLLPWHYVIVLNLRISLCSHTGLVRNCDRVCDCIFNLFLYYYIKLTLNMFFSYFCQHCLFEVMKILLSSDNPKMIDTEALLRLCLPKSALCAASSDNQLSHRYAHERISSAQNLLKTSEFNNRQKNLEPFSSPQFKNVETEFDASSKDGSSSPACRRFGQLPSPCGGDASLLNVHDPMFQ